MDDIYKAASLLKQGKVVAFPTETVYGLGALAFNQEAIENIFLLKNRAKDNPLIVHISDLEQVKTLARQVPASFYNLAKVFFPGPLTIVLKKHPRVLHSVTAGLDTVGIRIPSHPIAKKLLDIVGEPIAAPSANISGRPSPTKKQHVALDFQKKDLFILDGGQSEVGIESTVIDISSNRCTILRPGAITKEQLESVLNENVYIHLQDGKKALCPGMKYRHYAPKAKVVLCSSLLQIEQLSHKHTNHMILSDEQLESHKYLSSFTLYDHFRKADFLKCTHIFVLCTKKILNNSALMDRLSKAALD